MSRKRYVKAVPGRAVEDPDTGRRIGDEAVAVIDSPFWRRRIREGDVTEIPAAAVKPASETMPAPPETQPESQPASSRKAKN